MNPLLDKNINNTNNISTLVNMYKNMKDPNYLLNNNPQLRSIIQLYNGDAKSAFYAMCKERNIDPNSILSQFK